MGFRELPVTYAHAIAAGRLPPHQRDPFDRMLVSRDESIARYDVDILEA